MLCTYLVSHIPKTIVSSTDQKCVYLDRKCSCGYRAVAIVDAPFGSAELGVAQVRITEECSSDPSDAAVLQRIRGFSLRGSYICSPLVRSVSGLELHQRAAYCQTPQWGHGRAWTSIVFTTEFVGEDFPLDDNNTTH